MNKQEKWLPVVGFEGHYEVSDLGRVRSLDRRLRGKILKGNPDTKGYPKVSLSRPCHPVKIHRVHRLVAIAFIPNPANKPQINHIDNNRSNPKLINLEWATASENQNHAIKYFGVRVGEKSGSTRLKSSQIISIRNLRANGLKLTELAQQFGVSYQSISDICLGKRWKHIPLLRALLSPPKEGENKHE